MKPSQKPLRNRLIRHLREWHRKLGIIAAFFLIFLSVTGIALNHTESLSLAHKPIRSTWLLDHYGITPPDDVRFYDNNNLVVTNTVAWLDDKMLLDSGSEIISIVPVTINQISAFAIVSLEQLYFYSQKGELIEQLGEESGFPLGVTAIANTGDGIVVKTAKGMMHYNIEQYSWQEIQFIQEPNWNLPNKVNQQQIAKAKQNYRAQYLTLERIILDAHSGRIAGLMGVLFMDAVAVLLILLSLSGIYIWLRYANNKR